MAETGKEVAGISLKAAENVLARLFGVADAKRPAFSAKIQQLQRMGLPPGANPGRGTRFRYAYWQLAEFAIYLDLLDAGVPPNLIKIHFAHTGIYALEGIGEKAEHHDGASPNAVFLVLELRALNYLRANPSPQFFTVFKFRSGKTLGPELADVGNPAIIINLSKRLQDLKAVVADIVPSYADALVFPPTPPQPGKMA